MTEIVIKENNGLVTVKSEGKGHLNDLVAWQEENNEQLNELLYIHGALLFRRFYISDVYSFKKYLDQLPVSRLAYVDGNSPRTKLLPNIYTSTEFPPELSISMHNELSYSHSWPQKLYFCCNVAPQSAGHTLIADCRKVLKELDPSLVEEFRRRKVMYTRFLHGGQGVGPSWQETFETLAKTQVEEFCDKSEISYKWSKDGGVSLSQIGPGTLSHPVTKEEVWFNQADQFHISNLPKHIADTLAILTNGDKSRYPTYSYFGDKGEIPAEMLTEVKAIFKKNTVYFDWQVGDLLLIDNMLTAHGRSPFVGERKILVAMT